MARNHQGVRRKGGLRSIAFFVFGQAREHIAHQVFLDALGAFGWRKVCAHAQSLQARPFSSHPNHFNTQWAA